MKLEPIKHPKPQGEDSLLGDFALIGKAIADAFRVFSSSSRLDSRWFRPSACGGGPNQ
jgi:hypothetical protein